jgi:hypothetical protein
VAGSPILDRGGRIWDSVVEMRLRILVVVVLLAVWLLWGAAAVAFDHCAAMGVLCDTPCGLGIPCLPGVMPTLLRLGPTFFTPPIEQDLPTASPRSLDPVPRSLLSA